MAAKPAYPTDHEPTIEVRPAVSNFTDFATVVGPAKPGARGCWCMAYRDSRVAVDERRDFMRSLCRRDPGPGVLVYVDDVPAGWCSIAPRSSYRRLLNSRTIPAPDEPETWAAVCFVVRAGFRGHGLVHHLLTGAVSHASEHGAVSIEGYPVDARVDVISGYVGTIGMFEAAGFERVGTTSSRMAGRPRAVMRRGPA